MLEEYFERLRSEPWRDLAACRGKQKVFFKEQVKPGGYVYAEAKKICNDCVVKKECLDFALANHERYGCWGGMTYHERQEEARQRKGSASWVALAN